MTIAKHLAAIVLLPGMVLIAIPGLILCTTQAVSPGWGFRFPWALVPIIVGVLFIGAGLWLMVHTVKLFVQRGHGTLAPWSPTQRLVVQGVYRYARNPMMSGVYAVLLGEVILFGAWPLVFWLVPFVLVNAIYIPLWEERSLVRRFGSDYLEYKKHVPRWIPRLQPWTPPWEGDEDL
ncbi:MAG: isoprenylcysteine carboxylmethyltransferase family protein [Thermodesulfobacteriota bacterium]